MTLADIISERARRMTGHDLLEGCRIITVHKDVYKTACDLVARTGEKKLAELSRFTCWPDYNTWLETERDEEGRRIGFLFYGSLKSEKSVTYGYGLIVLDEPGKETLELPVRYDLEGYDIRYHRPMERADITRLLRGAGVDTLQSAMELFERQGDLMTQRILHAPLLNALKPILFALLALMNSPKLIRTRPINVDRLNARRLKQGRYPYHPHHEVRLNIDKHVMNITQGQGDGPERCLHFVRAHLRFLIHPRYKNVSAVLVPPHTRGNPELGIMNTSYVVDRENSKWVE